MTWLTVMEYLCHKWPRICSTCGKHFPILNFLIHDLSPGFLTKLTWQVPLVEQEFLSLFSEDLIEFTPVFSWVRVTRSLVLYVCFVDRSLSFCTIFVWPLCCLPSFDLRILITPLVSLNSSCALRLGYITYKTTLNKMKN